MENPAHQYFTTSHWPNCFGCEETSGYLGERFGRYALFGLRNQRLDNNVIVVVLK